MEENKTIRIESNFAWFELEELCEGCIYLTLEHNELTESVIDFGSVPSFETFHCGRKWIELQIKKMKIYNLISNHLEPINTNRLGEETTVIFPESILDIASELIKELGI